MTTALDRKTVILEGETPLESVRLLDAGLQPGRNIYVDDFPLLTFSKIARSLIKNGELYGDYVIKLSVSEVLFEDGSTWREGELGELRMAP